MKKKLKWGNLRGEWVELDVRDEIVQMVELISEKSHLNKNQLIQRLSIPKSRYYDWVKRQGCLNRHNGKIPKAHWILPEEKEKIIAYCRHKQDIGYRYLSYMMLDEDVVAVSPSTTYRILKKAGLLNRWNPKASKKGTGFIQPKEAHKHWHIDISYINILGTLYFLISILDGFSRYIVHHELRANMTGYDVEITLERAKEKYPLARPRIISDNGSQFISKNFKEYIRQSEYSHVRTSVAYPQSNGKLERFHGTIKSEEVRKSSYLSIEDARVHISKYIDFYNTKRLHSSIYYLTPEDVLNGRTAKRLKERQNKLDAAIDVRLKKHRTSKVA